MFFDPLYFLFLAPGILLALWAQWRVHSAYNRASQIAARSGYNGAQAADALLRGAGVEGVQIQPIEGFMTDHYVPGQHILRLSPQVYAGRSLAALGIAAHEAGHALQDAGRYPLLVMRNALVPMASVGSNMSWILIMIGFFLMAAHSVFGQPVMLLGIGAFSLTVLFQLINLPVEFDASRRARIALVDAGLVTADEDAEVARVLNAAALTYVAATLTAILTLLYFLVRSGLLGGSRD
jgi:Zn-dependent membrane protease YugP